MFVRTENNFFKLVLLFFIKVYINLSVWFSKNFSFYLSLFFFSGSDECVCGSCIYVVVYSDLLCHWFWHQLYAVIYHTISTSSFNPFPVYTCFLSVSFRVFIALATIHLLDIPTQNFRWKSVNEHLPFLIRIVCIVEIAFEGTNKLNKHESNRRSCVKIVQE